MKRASIFMLGALILASCATTSGLGTAADRLDSSARRFYQETNQDRAPRHTTDDAARLADAALDFNRAVDRTRSREDLQLSFDRVAERYHDLRRQVDDRDSRYGEASLAFERVTEAYLDVDRAMNHSGSANRP